MPDDPRRFTLRRYVNAVRGYHARAEAQATKPFDADFREVLEIQNLELTAYDVAVPNPRDVVVADSLVSFDSIRNADIMRGCYLRKWNDLERGGNFELSCGYKVIYNSLILIVKLPFFFSGDCSRWTNTSFDCPLPVLGHSCWKTLYVRFSLGKDYCLLSRKSSFWLESEFATTSYSEEPPGYVLFHHIWFRQKHAVRRYSGWKSARLVPSTRIPFWSRARAQQEGHWQPRTEASSDLCALLLSPRPSGT